MRQASTKSAAQAIAPSINPNRRKPSRSALKTILKATWCQTRPRTTVRRKPTTRAAHTRSAIRPILRLPATSCAEPGRTRVITMSAMARRNRTRAARSSVLKRVALWRSSNPREDAGGIECLSAGAAGEVVVLPASITSHTGHSPVRRAGRPSPRGGAPLLDLLALRQPVRAPDLRLAHPAHLVGRLGLQPGLRPGAPVGVDRHADEVRRGDVQRVRVRVVPC